MLKKILWTSVFLLVACGKDTGVSTQQFISLILQFPASIAKSSGRFESFLKRVEYMEVEVRNGGVVKTYRFPPAKWETLELSDVRIPQKSGEKLEIEIKVWDRREDGFRRTYPVLVGKKSFSFDEFKGDRCPNLRLILHAMCDL